MKRSGLACGRPGRWDCFCRKRKILKWVLAGHKMQW